MKPVYVYGINTVKSLLKNSPEKIIEIMVLDSKSVRKSEILNLSNQLDIACHTVGKQQLDKILPDAVHQGVVAKIKNKGLISENDFFASPSFKDESRKKIILILDQVQDPHNFGAILRTANACGVDAVVITKDRSAKITPIVSKVACGAAEITTIVEASNLVRFIEKLKEKQFWILGADVDATSQPINKFDSKNINNLALVMGAEGSGLRDLTKKNVDFLIHIPMYGEVESLNVSVATGVLLFDLKSRLV